MEYIHTSWHSVSCAILIYLCKSKSQSLDWNAWPIHSNNGNLKVCTYTYIHCPLPDVEVVLCISRDLRESLAVVVNHQVSRLLLLEEGIELLHHLSVGHPLHTLLCYLKSWYINICM